MPVRATCFALWLGVVAWAQGTSTAEALFSQALQLSQAGEFQASLGVLDQVLERAPDFHRAHDLIMRNYSGLGRLDDGRAYIERNPQQPHFCFGMLYYLQQAKRHKEQLELALTCTEQYDASPPMFDLLTNAAHALKRVESVAQILESRMRLTPDSPGVYFGLGSLESLIPARLQTAVEHLERARQLAPAYAEIDSTLNVVYAAQNRHREAAEAAQRLLSRARGRGDLDWEVRASVRLATAQTTLGKFQEAREALETALAKGKPIQRPNGERLNRESLGYVYYHLDRYEDALREYQAAHRIASQLKQRREASRILNSIGVMYRGMGDHARGLESYQQALQIAEELKDAGGQAFTLSNLSATHLDLGNHQEAIAYLERAFAISRGLSPWTAGRMAVDLASVYRQAGQPRKALEGYASSLRFAATAEDSYTALGARVARADLLTGLGRLKEAQSDLEAAQALAPAVGVKSEDAKLSMAWGRYELRRSVNAAVAHFQKAVDVANEIQAPMIQWQAHAGLADAYWRKGDFPSTLAHRQKAIEAIESVRSRLVTADQRAGFLASRVQLYKDTARVLDKLGRTREAFEAAEQGRARAMLDVLSDARAETANAGDEERNLRRNLEDAQKAVFQLAMTSKPGDRGMQTAVQRTETAERELSRLWASAGRQAATAAAKPATLGAIQASLPRGSALLHYTMHPEGGLLHVVTANQIHRYPLAASGRIEQQVIRLRDTLAKPPSRVTQAEWIADANALYQSLIAPAASAIEGAKEWIIVPDGVLHMLPFEILLSSVPARPELDKLPYIGRARLTRYAPSASVMAALRRPRDTTTQGLLALGGALYGTRPLPHSEKEVRGVTPFYRNPRVLIGALANEAEVKRTPGLESMRVLHFAVHGLLNEQRPQLSGLLLSRPKPGEEEDGFLQAFEIARMKLGAELVVLSACETALGKQITGEGIAGLTQAFFSAGARGVVASLWRVDDESTAALMSSFHRALQQPGVSAGEAMRRARLELMQRPEFAHPFYWAPFVVMGAR